MQSTLSQQSCQANCFRPSAVRARALPESLEHSGHRQQNHGASQGYQRRREDNQRTAGAHRVRGRQRRRSKASTSHQQSSDKQQRVHRCGSGLPGTFLPAGRSLRTVSPEESRINSRSRIAPGPEDPLAQPSVTELLTHVDAFARAAKRPAADQPAGRTPLGSSGVTRWTPAVSRPSGHSGHSVIPPGGIRPPPITHRG